MEQVTAIGLDIAKHVFQVHGADGARHVLFRKRVTRVRLLSFGSASPVRRGDGRLNVDGGQRRDWKGGAQTRRPQPCS
jgi:hypothetical protein